MKANARSLRGERGEITIGTMVMLGITLIFSAVLFVVLSTQADVASTNSSLAGNATKSGATGGKDLVLLLPFVGIGLVVVAIAREMFR